MQVSNSPGLSRTFRLATTWIALPVGVAVLALAEFSRYLVANPVPPALRVVLAPRTLLYVTAAVLVAWLVLGLASRQFRLRAADAWWLGVPVLLGAWSVLGLLWSPAAEARTYLAEFWLYGLLLTLLLGTLGQPIRNRWWLVGGTFVGVGVVVGIALIEKITDTHLPLSNLANPFREQWAVTSVFINQNHLAASLAIFVPLLVGAGLSHPRFRWLLLPTALGGVVALFFTGSTLAWVGLLVAAAIFGLLELVYAPRLAPRRKLLVGVGTAVLAAAVLAGTWFALPSSIRDRFSVAAEGVSKSVHERTELLSIGTELALRYPLRGLGPAAAEGAVRAVGRTQVQNLHDLALEVAVNFGIPALLLFVAWVVSLVVHLLRSLYQLGPGQRPELHRSIATIAALIGLLAVQAAPSTFVGVRAPWILLGLALALVRDHVVRGASTPAHART